MSTAVTPSPPEIDRTLAREMLRNGNHLDQPTFHRYYEAAGPDYRAELLRGVVYGASPISGSHAYFHVDSTAWLRYYTRRTLGTAAWSCASYILGGDSELQPDLSVTLKAPGVHPSAVPSPFHSPPKLIVEVAYSSRAYDLFEKKSLYEEYGVEEYLVVSLAQRKVYWFARSGAQFHELQPDTNQVLRSVALPGLWLNVPALFEPDLEKVERTVDEGLRSPEHAAFVDSLKRQFPSN